MEARGRPSRGSHDSSSRTLILGLGNEILRDDGVGLVAARRLARLAGDRADLAEASVATIDLLPMISGYDRLIVVDAYLSPSDPPGTPVHATPGMLRSGFGYRSFHNLPFDELLELGRRLDQKVPRSVSVHGLSVADPSTFGRRFTDAVARAWRPWVDRIAKLEFGTRASPVADESLDRRRAGG